MSRDVTGYCAFHAFAGTEAERETCEDCHAMQKMGERMFQPPATPQEPEPYGPFFDPCGKCITRTHCAHHDRCLAECVPADLRASSAKAAVYLAKEVDAARAAEAAQHQQALERLTRQAQDISVTLGEAGCRAMPIVDGVRWLVDHNLQLRARLAAVEEERDAFKAENGEVRRLAVKERAELAALCALAALEFAAGVLFGYHMWGQP